MKNTVIAALALSLSSSAYSEVFGKFVDETKPTENLAKLVSENKTEKLVITEGTVKQVCEMKGCWMTLNEGDKTVRVFFKGHSFFVGKQLIGKKVKAEGTLQKKTQTVAEQKHFLEDAAAPKSEIEKVKAPLETFTFEATAVATL